MLCASPWEAYPFLNDDGEGVGGEEDGWERGEDSRRGGKGNWPLCKINEKNHLNNKRKRKEEFYLHY